MISDGEWYKLIPKDLEGNLRYRKKIIEECIKDADFRSGVLAICKRDIIFWINTFVMQFNPQHKGDEVGPFITWGFQDEAILEIISCIEEGRDLRIEKSREMGATWVCLLVMLWYCLFHKWKKFLLTSRDEDAVDKAGDSDSLMWKIMFAVGWLPSWMNAGILKKKMAIDFALTSCNITGEAATAKAGVGGRYTAAFMDEFSQNPKADEVFARTADSTKCRIFNFTHVGVDTMAYKICYDEQYSDMRSVSMHWLLHPEKYPGAYRFNAETNDVEIIDKTYKFDLDYKWVMDGKPVGGPFPGIRSPWYDAECRRRPARAIAMDLDIDPRGATKQFYDAVIIASLKNKFTRPADWVGELKYDPKTGNPIELIESEQGKLRLWVHPKSATEVPAVKGAAGCDISWGTGATPSCFSLMNATTGSKIVEYVNSHIGPVEAANYFTAICKLFKSKTGLGARMCWEIQGPGIIFGRRVIELGYLNIYWREDEDSLGKIRDNKMRPGWNPSPRAIMALHSDYWDALREKKYLNPSWDALDETLNFVFSGTSIEYRGRKLADADDPSGSRVHHGDIAIADALSWKMGKDDWQPAILEEKIVEVADLRTFAGRLSIAESAYVEDDCLAWDE